MSFAFYVPAAYAVFPAASLDSMSTVTQEDVRVPFRLYLKPKLYLLFIHISFNDANKGPQAASQSDPKQKRKAMKHNKRDDGGREVTDPVTHLPIVIRDSTEKDMKRAPENEPAPGTEKRSATGLSGASKDSSELDQEQKELQGDHIAMEKLFPPPNFEDAKAELMRIFQFALTVGVGSILVLATLVLVVWQLLDLRRPRSQHGGLLKSDEEKPTRLFIPISVTVLLSATIGGSLIWALQGWLGKIVQETWEDEVWDGARHKEQQLIEQDDYLPESVAWLNSLLASVWPLINPDLFTSISDMLEDVMQASLPKIVRMVSVNDLGQGSESLRILGIKWLPTGAASQTVDKDGKLEKSSQGNSDRTAPGEGQIDNKADNEGKGDGDSDDEDKKLSKEDAAKRKADEEEQEAIRQGMEAEQGDFVNMEMAFAYRARSSGKSLKLKAKNAHLYLKFYLPGGIAVPVWVELRGIIGTMRLRLQLTPDPPFFSLCTLTFLGQPRADLSCVPLSKHNVNLMDLPLLSSFVQSSIDAALAEYVAPKSLTLDLKDMIVGDDFKKDTAARGVVMVFIKSAKDFKEGDGGVGPIKGSSDAYVTVSWSKFGKPVASTRIIIDDQNPRWDEWAFILFGAEELNAGEKLRLQLWDSDKHTADDDLGRVEVDLKKLMSNPTTQKQMCEREDRLTGEDPEEKMPGYVQWSVGYFAKTKITDEQLKNQTAEPDIRSKEDLKKKVTETAERKLREATAKDESKEIDQQRTKDYKEREDALVISSPPSTEFKSGILSIQIHNITGLEVEQLNKNSKKTDSEDREDEAEESDDLPSSYCTIIMNHQKIFRTRTKPKNAKPFFNTGTEKFIKDWTTTEIMISVRDDRERENDALLGIVDLPLAKVFENRSQVMDSYPIAGGIGYGRARISMVFRSVEMHLPKELMGWDYGTLEVKAPVKTKGQLQDDLSIYRIKLRSNLDRVKMQAEGGEWTPKNGKKSVFLPFRKRYSAALIIEFRKSSIGTDSTPGFAVFWLKDIPDDEEKTITMKVWKGGKEALKKATTCCDYTGLEENEHCLGEIEVCMKFWRGLSGYHKAFAQKGKNGDIRDVMEVLDTANDEREDEGATEDNSDDSEDSDDDTNTNDGNDTDDGDHATKEALNRGLKADADTPTSSSASSTHSTSGNSLIGKLKGIVDGHNKSDDGSRGVVNQAMDYKDHHKQLHRKHKGIMQWKGARTVDWMVEGMRQGKGKASGMFEHQERTTGIETEV
jgi:C2 domain